MIKTDGLEDGMIKTVGSKDGMIDNEGSNDGMIETEGFNDVNLFEVRKRYEMKLTKMSSYQSMHSKYTTYK